MAAAAAVVSAAAATPVDTQTLVIAAVHSIQRADPSAGVAMRALLKWDLELTTVQVETVFHAHLIRKHDNSAEALSESARELLVRFHNLHAARNVGRIDTRPVSGGLHQELLNEFPEIQQSILDQAKYLPSTTAAKESDTVKRKVPEEVDVAEASPVQKKSRATATAATDDRTIAQVKADIHRVEQELEALLRKEKELKAAAASSSSTAAATATPAVLAPTLKQSTLLSAFGVTTTNPSVTVSIIGTAGRKEDGPKMSAALFDRMCTAASRIIQDEWKLSPGMVQLVSGGAAWADHVAVKLYIGSVLGAVAHRNGDESMFAGLTVHLPCAMNEIKSSAPTAVDTGSSDWKSNPGRLMNQLHREFTAKLGRNTMVDILAARAYGAKLTVSNGFHARNAIVATSKYVLAFTWGEGDTPKDGGTKFTWDKAKTLYKRHVPLKTLL